MTPTTALIIGAGIGGLATAIKLADAGYRVHIFEKLTRAGGRCGRISYRGHIFDTGPTMYLFPEIYEQFFRSIGENVRDYLTLLPVDPTYTLFFSDSSRLRLTPRLPDMKKQLERIEPGSYEQYLRYTACGKKHYETAMNVISGKPLSRAVDYFNLQNIYTLATNMCLPPHYFYTRFFFRDPRLRIATTFQDSYLSLNPYTSPSIYSLFTYSEGKGDSYLPAGGMYSVIEALERIATSRGVATHYGREVKKLQTDGTEITGVLFADGSTEKADSYIVNADLTHAYTQLLPDEPYAKKLLTKKYSCSAIAYHWALTREVPGLSTHNLFFAEDYRRSFTRVIDRRVPPERPHFYIQAPSRTDSTRAPRGRDTLTVMVPINHLYPGHIFEWDGYTERARTYILDRLQRAGLGNIRDSIIHETVHTPRDWETHLSLPFGSIYGLHHNLSQLGYLRPKRRHARYKNLFFTGASTHPGSGLPTVLLSAGYTADTIVGNKRT